MGKIDAGPAEPPRRQVAYVCGQWRVTYQCSGEPDRKAGVWFGMLVGPLVPDQSSVLWVEVVPDGSTQRTMIRRDSITDITSPHHARKKNQSVLTGPHR